MLPEEKARVKIDKQLNNAGWDIVARGEYIPNSTSAVKEALMQGNTESDYLLFIEGKAIAVVEAKREENSLDVAVEKQAEGYATHPQNWYGLWFDNLIPLVYLANGNKIYFKNMLVADSKYKELTKMHSPKEMLKIMHETPKHEAPKENLELLSEPSEYAALPRLEKRGLRDCQYEAEIELEKSFKAGNKKNLAILATGAGKTYLACLASYRLLNYTSTKRILFLVDRNNLARQTESEFAQFDRTENQELMSDLYKIYRLKKENDIKGDIVISTIQKLYCVLTGQKLTDADEDAEDEMTTRDEDKNEKENIALGSDLKLPPNYFQFIIVDECHRSIYGKWKAVLDYFSGAKVLGLTATPTPEAYAFFNNNIIEKYSYEDSVVDGVNVPSRVYRIETKITTKGGTIEAGTKVLETPKGQNSATEYITDHPIDYDPTQIDRSVVIPDQIRQVLLAYKKAIYEDLYPNREKKWEYIPKTLIFAKNDNHATEIVEMVKEVFRVEFEDEKLPEHFVQKITYSAGDSNALIRDFQTEKDFRIAITVTLVATGTDIKPLEVVMFMKDVHSDVLYTQMKGRGCRTLSDDKLNEVTPNADTKECYYIVDAVGVTEHEKNIPKSSSKPGSERTLSLKDLIERLSHDDLSDNNLILLGNYCSSINRRYENNPLFGHHLDYFIDTFGFAPRTLANDINKAYLNGSMAEYISPSHDNTMRNGLISCLMSSIPARKKLIEMQRGYRVSVQDKDEITFVGFSKETARTFIDNFEKYLVDNKDEIEALRIIYNSEDVVITHQMLLKLQDRLLAENSQYGITQIWRNYKILDTNGTVDELDTKNNVKALTNLIQIVRYAYKKNLKLTSLRNGYASRFALYCGQNQRFLTDNQKDIMKQIAECIIDEGAITFKELNSSDTDLWRKGIKEFTAPVLKSEMHSLAKFILKVA